jgi:hypothetical protein
MAVAPTSKVPTQGKTNVAPSYLGPVGQAVYGYTPSPGLRTALLVGAFLEGGLHPPYGVGDGGTSFGPWQMHIGGALDSIPGTLAQKRAAAENPFVAVKYMGPRYRLAGGEQSGGTASGAALVAFRAERPANMYPSSRVQAAWAAIHGAASSGTGAPDVTAPIRGAVDAATGTAHAVGTLVDDVQIAGKYLGNPVTWIRVGEFALGAILIVVGVSIMARPITQPAAQAAISAAKVLPV